MALRRSLIVDAPNSAAAIALRKSDRLEALSCTSVGPTRIADRKSLMSEAERVAVTALIAERKSDMSDAWIGAPAVIALRRSLMVDAPSSASTIAERMSDKL